MFDNCNQKMIIDGNKIPFNQDFLITLTNNDNNSIDLEKLRKCKILKIAVDENSDENLVSILNLDPKVYENLFVFIIETESLKSTEFIKVLKNYLVRFSTTRPIILILSCNEKTKFFYKEQDSVEFFDVKDQKLNKVEHFYNFATFLTFLLNEQSNNFEETLLEKIFSVQNSSLIIRFVRTFNLSKEFFENLIQNCAAKGSMSDFIAAMDMRYDYETLNKSPEEQIYLTELNFCEDSMNDLSSESDYMSAEEDINSSSSESSYRSSCSKIKTSTLFLSIINSNKDVAGLIVNNCKDIIRQFPLGHQVQISSAAFKNNQIEILCDLLEYCDYPFPKNVNINGVTDMRLLGIIENRKQFHKNVVDGNITKIESFSRSNPQIKFAFNLENKSVMSQALKFKSFKSFFHLKALRFRYDDIEHFDNVLNHVLTKKKPKILAALQRRENVEISTASNNKSILKLMTRSFIYNRSNDNKSENEHRNKINKWFKEIYESIFGSKLLNAAAQCEHLKIIFDFECISAENVDVSQSSECLGATYPVSKWIFVGAKLTDEKTREQKIKGVLAHEICHYVMRLVYENDEKPYYKGDEKCFKDFEEITTEIHSMLFPEIDEKDDDCLGIIKTVYTGYLPNAYHPELIVRPVHIQVQFDDDEEKIKQLEIKYNKLFKYFKYVVLPEIDKFCLEDRNTVKTFNDCINILPKLQKLNLQFESTSDIDKLMDSKITIVSSNVPKLLLLKIYNHLCQKFGTLFDKLNIFINSNDLTIWNNFKNNLTQKQISNIFVDCTEGADDDLCIVHSEVESKIILIVASSEESDKLSEKLKENHFSAEKLIIDFNWMDLKAESQEILLKTKICFQNNTNYSLFELFEIEQQQNNLELRSYDKFSQICDDQLINLLVEKAQIIINSQKEEEFDEKIFKILFQARNLIKTDEINESNKMLINDLKETEEKLRNIVDESIIESIKKNRIFYENKKFKEISQEQVLKHVNNKRYLLISDKAGSGKSWVLKNFAKILREKYSNKWITYVDLKQFIQEFKPPDTCLEFSTFMTEKILKLKTKFESEIFEKLYKNGKVCILFDGFDEIAPDCAEFVTKLFQSFQQNGGNQLWIATRDYFEVDLKEKLGLDAVYKLDEFTDDHGVELIATCWVLNEIKEKINSMTSTHVTRLIKKSKNYKLYKRYANALKKNFLNLVSNSIGLPQFYKMIGDIFKDKKDSKGFLTTLKIYTKFVDIQCERWSNEKGHLRTNESTDIQHRNINYHKLHELIAMDSLFPDESQFCDLDIGDLDWTDVEIVGCGMLIKRNGKFLFTHETVREYYAAHFIIRIFAKRNIDDKICEYFIRFLTVQNFGIIRMFLNEAFAEKSTLAKIEQKIPKIVQFVSENVDLMKNLNQIFEEKLENFANLLIKIFNHIENYDSIKTILIQNNLMAVSAVQNSNLFINLQNFIFNFLNENDLKEFLKENSIFLSIISSRLDVKTITEFIDELERRRNLTFVKEMMQMVDKNNSNLLHYLVLSEDTDCSKFQEIFKHLKKYLKADEIIELIRSCNKNGENMFHIAILTTNEAKLKFLWTEFEHLFKNQNLTKQFKELFSQQTSESFRNVLHVAASCDKMEFHMTMWKLLLNTLNENELEDLIMQNDKDGDNFVHYLLIYNKLDIIKFTFNIIKEHIKCDQYGEILKSKGQTSRNLLQLAASKSHDIKLHQFLWRIFRDFFKSDDSFLNIIKEVNQNGNNILHITAMFATNEIFDFMINELANITSVEKVRNILNTTGHANKNLIHTAAVHNKSLEFHESLWKIITNYVDASEILDMIKNINVKGFNIIQNIIECNTKRIAKWTWNEVTKVLFSDYYFKINLTALWKECNDHFMNALENPTDRYSMGMLKVKFDELVMKFKFLDSQKLFGKVLRREISAKDFNILHKLVPCDKIQFHDALWEILLEDKEELKSLILQKNATDNNFVHILVINGQPKIIEFVLKKLKENFKNEQYEMFLKSKGEKERNLLQNAAFESRDIETHRTIWNIFQDFCKSNELFLENLRNFDNEGSNVFHIAVGSATSEIFELIIGKLEMVATIEDIKIVLKTFGVFNGNLLHAATNSNKYPKVHEILWKLLKKYLNNTEMLHMVHHLSKYDSNIFHIVLCSNTIEIIELTWNQIKEIITTKEDQTEYLKIKGYTGINIHEFSKKNPVDCFEVQCWVEKLLQEYKIVF